MAPRLGDRGVGEAGDDGRAADENLAGTLTETLDLVAEAVVLLDASGRVLRMNRAARALLGRCGGVSLAQDGRLLVPGPARDALAEALQACAAAVGLAEPTPLRIAVPRPGAWPLLLALQPLQARGARAPVAAAFISDPQSAPRDATAVLQSAYGLSPAEARLAAAIAQGLSLKQVARRDDLSYETVRSYVKRVLMKTGTRRQVDLVRLTGTLR